VAGLRAYLNSGGFLFANDDYGMDQSFRREIARVFPDQKLIELPFSHPIYHCFYDFPHGLPKKVVTDIIQGTYADRPKMLRGFGDMIFNKPVSPAFSDWIFDLGLQASGWATAAIAKTWLGEEGLFADLKKIEAPTLILHGKHDKVCLFPLAIAQRDSIKHSRLIPFEESGHFLFIDEQDKFTRELLKFTEE
jgi:non-heme chloroperoxidase